MSIIVNCTCGKKLQIKEELVGKRGKCPACGIAFTIPSPSNGVASIKRAGSGAKCPLCREELLPNAVLCVNCGHHLQSGQNLTTKTSKASPSQPMGETSTEKKAPAQVPRWCKTVLMFDLVWCWVVVLNVIALFIGTIIFTKIRWLTIGTQEWTMWGLFVALFATLATIRLLKAKPSGVWLGYVTLGLALFEQWVRIDENQTPQLLPIVLGVGIVVYDIVYLLAILSVNKVIKQGVR